MSLTLTPDQQEAAARIRRWVTFEASQTLTLGGYAGTGKTTLINTLLEEELWGTRVLAPTGKACQVLQRKGVEHAKTIHSFLYFPPEEDQKTEELKWTARGVRGSEFAVCDEASMIARPVYDELIKTGFRILFVGDHGQLPPVGEDPGIMRHPQARLEQIVRQAAESPILRFAHSVRLGEEMTSREGPELTVRQPGFSHDPSFLSQFDQVLCATNNTRILINMLMRAFHGRKDLLCKDDKIICLRNDYRRRLVNGQICTVVSKPTRTGENLWVDLVDETGEEYWSVPVYAGQLHQRKLMTQADRNTCLFDFAYAITVHKSQGSEWDSVLVIEEPVSGDLWDPRRWRYTAATRAAKRLDFLSPYVTDQRQRGLFDAA